MAQNPKPILVVEDEPQVRTLLKTMLAQSGFDVIAAKDGTSAFRELRKRGGEFDLVVTDVDMGRMNGLELAESVRSEYPSVPILFVSGLPVAPGELEKVAPGTLLLSKPFTSAALLEAVQKLTGDRM
jgi:CheY-like chemotaxis protein